jgi:hypothetical protein
MAADCRTQHAVCAAISEPGGRREYERQTLCTAPDLGLARPRAVRFADAAGVPPKIASVLMGHEIPDRQPGAAQRALVRYAHALPEESARLSKRAAYLAENQKAEAVGE